MTWKQEIEHKLKDELVFNAYRIVKLVKFHKSMIKKVSYNDFLQYLKKLESEGKIVKIEVSSKTKLFMKTELL